jgi:hypothetical protein
MGPKVSLMGEESGAQGRTAPGAAQVIEKYAIKDLPRRTCVPLVFPALKFQPLAFLPQKSERSFIQTTARLSPGGAYA